MTIESTLKTGIARWFPGATGIDRLAQLSGGASQETWSFNVLHTSGDMAVILRRAPSGYGAAPGRAAGLEAEAVLMQQAYEAGVPSPRVRYVLRADDGLGSGFIMDRVEGETIPRKILRDAEFANARKVLASQLGRVVADIHALDKARLPKLRLMTVAGELDDLAAEYKSFDWPRPVFDLALRWLRDNAPTTSDTVTLVHGDFRHGNLIIGPEGVRAVLDWELAHFGDPMEDLGWICVNSWRFGEIDKPVGGLGSREDLFAAYEAASGRPVDVARVMFWETLGTLRWGIMCCGMMQRFRAGPDHSMERAMIGRRASETEIDLLRLLAPRRGK
ncbi:MAG TPA: phosphotransferase family protein [Afipia sp.]|uniref:phosphotransferase family protein n=1 Tax=unclassified Afipia TaxID=2642050 RepID=UPI0004635997|nr:MULTISPECIES: phosphotransferase family protein [unclassified Afipia]MAH68805.1 phosphotransferase family protein [Afipia sp.]OUX61980.1 MAG: phosphotransferase family protein [Afipia sp. TMED4]MAH69021.1 phosphotransferase family protein [Afipia sp.]OUX62144.1 MAG: phosphotransferase family protein [Afipia sp. TMED4]HAP13866.1 phosphotransferase family protein [Afipia sp.]